MSSETPILPKDQSAGGKSLNPSNILNRRKTDTRPTGIVVVIPAFNEERFIGSVVILAKRLAGEVIVVDDGSSDHSAEIAENAGATVLQSKENQGKASALNLGLMAAIGCSPEVIVVMDADFQHLPNELPRLIAPILSKNADMVIGSRYLSNTSQVPLSRVFGHRFFNFLTRMASGTNTTDSQSGFRAFTCAAAEQLVFYSRGFSVESEMQFIAHEHKLRLVEVPITIQYLDRPKRSVTNHGLGVLNGIIRLVAFYRPLLFFGLPGFLLIGTGVGGGLWVVDRYNQIKVLAVGTALISVMLVIVGLTFFSTGIILHSIRSVMVDVFRQREKS